MPETCPAIKIDLAGVCSACRYHENKKEIDWAARKREFLQEFETSRAQKKTQWDCVVPISGEIESSYQIIRMLELGLNPLCVVAALGKLSEIGQRNLERIKELGVDSYDITPQPDIHRRMDRLSMRHTGDLSWPDRLISFTAPTRVAVQFGIPTIVWPDNPHREYGGALAYLHNIALTRAVIEEIGSLTGLRANDLIGQDGIEEKHLIPYNFPTDEEFKHVGVKAIFLSHYFPWDPVANTLIAQTRGFEIFPHCVEGTASSSEHLSNIYSGISNYLGFIKYGFGRASDSVSRAIRRGVLTRADGLAIVGLREGHYPSSYLGVPLEKQLSGLDLTVSDFDALCERFTNKKLFVCDAQGSFVRGTHKKLKKINDDNP
jgi:N-acetyl sugar amidotransferase